MNVTQHYDYTGDAEGLRKALIETFTERKELVPKGKQGTLIRTAHCNGERDAYEQVLQLLGKLKVTP